MVGGLWRLKKVLWARGMGSFGSVAEVGDGADIYWQKYGEFLRGKKAEIKKLFSSTLKTQNSNFGNFCGS